MKKVLFVLCIVFSLASCVQLSDNQAREQMNTTQQIVFDLTARHPLATKAIKTGWETGDVLFVFFSGKTAPAYLEMKWNGTKWQNTPKNGLSFTNGDSGTMRAVYLPFGNDFDVVADGTSFAFDNTQFSYYMTSAVSYSVSENKISGDFAMAIPEGFVQLFLDNTTASSSDVVELREPRLRTRTIASISADCTITESSSAWGAPLTGYVYDKENKKTGESKGYLFSGELITSVRNVETDYLFTFVSGGFSGNYFTKQFTGKTMYKSSSAGRAIKLPAISGWNSTTTHKPVDLGIDVDGKRIYWSMVNIGASKETDYGDYFAWGETTTKDDFQWATYKHGNTATALTKYNTKSDNGTVDNKTTLEAADDVVTTKLSGNRRIPTKSEWEALVTNCTWAWKTTADGYEHNGYLITGKGAYATNHVFLPAAGAKSGTDYQTDLLPEDFGGYWSSSLDSDTPSNAWRLGISVSNKTLYAYYRSSGLTIRPVIE